MNLLPRSLSRLLGFSARRNASVGGGGYVPAAPILSGTYVTPQTALGLAAVYASINVISGDIASIPRYVYRKLPDGGRVIDESHPLNDLLRVAPNDDMDSLSYFQSSMGHVLGWGNGMSRIVRDNRDGRPTALALLHPDKTKPKRTEVTKQLYYELDGDDRQRLSPENVLHFAGLGFNGIVGYSPITVARQTIGLAMGAEQFGAAFFGNGAIARGILKLAKRLSTNAQNNLRASINQVHQGSQSAHQFLILEEGMDWVANQVNPNDGQWIETRGFQVKEIARIFSIPPHKIGDYSESHLANVEEANRDYLETTLRRWVDKLKAQLNLKLLTARDRLTWEIDFDLDEFRSGNTVARMDKYRTMRNMGAMNADDILRAEGMNPIGPAKGGDLYIVQGQYVPLNQIGKTVETSQPPPLRKPPAKRFKRFNPHHSSDGKFASGHGGKHAAALNLSFKRSDAARSQKSPTVVVDVAKFNAAWKRDSDHVPLGGRADNQQKYRNAIEFIHRAKADGIAVEQSRATVDTDGTVSFADGRHRFAALRDLGATAVPVSVDRHDAARAKRRYGVRSATLDRPTGLLEDPAAHAGREPSPVGETPSKETHRDPGDMADAAPDQATPQP